MLELSPNYWSARRARTTALTEQQPLLVTYLAYLRGAAPNHPLVRQLEFTAARQVGNEQEASRLIESVFQIVLSTQSMVVLAPQKRRSGDTEGAISPIKGWLDENPEDSSAREALASM